VVADLSVESHVIAIASHRDPAVYAEPDRCRRAAHPMGLLLVNPLPEPFPP